MKVFFSFLGGAGFERSQPKTPQAAVRIRGEFEIFVSPEFDEHAYNRCQQGSGRETKKDRLSISEMVTH